MNIKQYCENDKMPMDATRQNKKQNSAKEASHKTVQDIEQDWKQNGVNGLTKNIKREAS